MRDKISNFEAALIAALALLTNAFSALPGALAGGGVWISNILAAAVGFAFAYFFSSACEKFPEETFFGVMEKSIGHIGAVFFGTAFLASSLLTLTVSLTVFSRFVQITALPQTPPAFLSFMILSLAAFVLLRGAASLSGTARLLFIFSAAVVVLFFILGFKNILPRALLPDFEKTDRILQGAGEVFLNRFTTVTALMSVYTRMEKRETRKKYFFSAVLLAAAVFIIISVICVAVLGKGTAELDFYPAFTVMASRDVGGFVRHTELFACIAMTVSLFFKSAASLLFLRDILKGIFKIPGECKIYFPLALITCAVSQIIYSDVTSLRAMLEWKSGAGYVLAALFFLSFVLFAAAKIKKKET